MIRRVLRVVTDRADDAEKPDTVAETGRSDPDRDPSATAAEDTDDAHDSDDDLAADAADAHDGRLRFSRLAAYGVLPAIAVLMVIAAGLLKWHDFSARDSQSAGAEAVHAASDATIALLSYKPATVEKDLEAARAGLTGTFLDSYTSLTRDVVIPGAKQKQISAVATVPAAAAVSATENHAVAMLFVNQTVIIGQDAPTETASSVRVTLDRVAGRWLISQFEPI
ncbi:MAG: hypothetical protein VYA67_00500 [Actinomycetota bacterium]|uniref:Mce associated membrane protein n=1 Tax=Mycobacterium lentiflavum TaxID=141349 RepID=A0ABY3UP15_MYCLN|nr:hypothetical protein [Mycobacterium lentiflavum]MEE3062432.1 hypothetical protein [Actinomycetota bacterium]ULP40343.1 hypothetical protein MJO58_15055 [Mycobacterium lentiflavum]